LMGGRIGVESELGQGSTFCFEVPLEPCGGDNKSTDSVLEDQSDPSSDLAEKWVLLAEDNTTNQLFAREVLKDAGMHCDCVVNGEEALVAVGAQAYDVVLMDCQMPEMDGFEATRTIRQLEHDGELDGHLPIIALTANAVKGDRERCIEAGMDDYISKPFEAQKLLQLIAQLLGSVSASPSSEEAGERQPTGASESNAPLPINHAELLTRCMGKLDLAEELLADFEVDLPRKVDEVSRSIAEVDAQATGASAHSLKGAAGMMGAESLRQIAAAIESAGKSDCLEGVPALLDELNAETRRLFDALPEIRRELASQSEKQSGS